MPIGIGCQLDANWIPIGSQLDANWIPIGYQLDTNWIPIGYQLDTNWISIGLIGSIGYQLDTNWISIGYQLDINWINWIPIGVHDDPITTFLQALQAAQALGCGFWRQDGGKSHVAVSVPLLFHPRGVGVPPRLE
eukprot:SAG31_NODE_140_length_22731_cov_10.941410_21_plen_135_part_00